MGQRIDHFDDPNAPRPNSLVPSVNALVMNDVGEVLLICRSDNGNWSLPGGAMDLGESLGQAAIREAREETGIDIKLTGVSGLYSNPKHLVEYTSDGEVRQEFTIVFTAVPVGGEPTASEESTHVDWFSRERIENLTMHRSMRKRLDFFFATPDQLHWD